MRYNTNIRRENKRRKYIVFPREKSELMSGHTTGKVRQKKHSVLDKRIPIIVSGLEHAPIAWIDNDDTEDGPANARRLVQCWNSHDELVEACKAAYSYVSGNSLPSKGQVIVLLREALNLAETEK
jgi:hypothetical protein